MSEDLEVNAFAAPAREVAGNNGELKEVLSKIARVEQEITSLDKQIKEMDCQLEQQSVGLLKRLDLLKPRNERLNKLQDEKNILLQQQQQQAAALANDGFRSGKRSKSDSPNSDKPSSSGSSGSGSKRRRIDHSDEAEGEAMQKARNYVQSIMNAQEDILDKNLGISALENISDIWTGGKFIVIVRSITRDFWQQCINTTKDGYRVCAVGTPGIGKSTSIPVLIKMLLEDDKTVVYLRRSGKGWRWKYQFKNTQVGIDVEVFPESMPDVRIPALKEPDTFYIIDPEKTDDDSNPEIDVPAKVIIVASADSRHWGRNEFAKQRGSHKGGTFKYYPLWENAELRVARGRLNPNLSDTDMLSRIQNFGGVPRKVFADSTLGAEEDQVRGLNQLTADQAMSLFQGDFVAVDTSDTTAPSSAVIGYRSHTPFGIREKEVVLVSDAVAQKICSKYLTQLWKAMEKAPTSSSMGDAFEVYVRLHMIGLPADGREFDARLAVGMKHDDRSFREKLNLPKCSAVQQSLDIISAVRNGDNLIVYHSVNEFNPLIDFVFKDGPIFYAVQVTIGKTHDAEKKKIEDMVRKLQLARGEQVMLLYAVPAFIFENFVTKPVEPAVPGCPVKVISILNPTENVRQQ